MDALQRKQYVCPCGATFWSVRGPKSARNTRPPVYCETCRFKKQRDRMGMGWGNLGKNKTWKSEPRQKP